MLNNKKGWILWATLKEMFGEVKRNFKFTGQYYGGGVWLAEGLNS